MPSEQAFYDAAKRVGVDRTFLSDSAGDSLSYGELCSLAAQFESSFSAIGLRSGDPVAVIVPQSTTAVATIVATLMVTVAAPLNPGLAVPEVLGLLRRIGPRAVVVSAGLDRDMLTALGELGVPVLHVASFPQIALTVTDSTTPEAINAETSRRSGAHGVLLPTSGTTGDPKLVFLDESRLVHAARGIGKILELNSDDRNLCVLPCYHIHGLSTVLATVLTGGSVLAAGPFSAQDVVSILISGQVSWLSATPTHFRALLKALDGSELPPQPNALRFLRSASAPLSKALLLEIEAAFSVPVIQAYGMTEAGPQIASNGLASEHSRSGSVGRPVGTEVKIVANGGHCAACNEAGEITIRGASVVREYFSAGQEDAQSFDGDWFHTGDLGFLDEEGFLYLTGRRDDLINSGGEKVAPQQLEEVLQEHPAVLDVAVFPASHTVLGEVAHAAVVLQDGFIFADAHFDEAVALERILRRYCLSQLAAFKVPHKFHFVPGIPVDDSGKLQRRTLHGLLAPPLQKARHASSGEPTHPALREAVIAAWLDVLGPGEYGADDDFFLCGGDSLTATMATNRLADEFRIDLPVNSFFAYPTVAQQVALLSKMVSGETSSAASRLEVSAASCVEQILPLSSGQRRLWFLDQAGAGSEYNMSQPIWLHGELDNESLQGTINWLRKRHSALRTTINRMDGHPVQRIVPFSPEQLTVADLSDLPVEAAREKALALAAESRNEPFDLAKGPLFRCQLVRVSAKCHLLLITIHHIVCDAWSMAILQRELGVYYRAICSGVPADDSSDRVQDTAYIRGILADERRTGPRQQEILQWWSQQLDRVEPVLHLPYSTDKQCYKPKIGARLHFEIPDETKAQLASVAQGLGTTLYALFVGILGIVLHRYSGQQRFCLGTVSANRSTAELEQLVGFFARTLPLPVDISMTDTLETVLIRCAGQVREVLAHAEVEFDELVRVSGVDRRGDTTPLFQVMLAFQNLPHALDASEIDDWPEGAPGIEMEPVVVDGDSAKFDLSLYLRPAAGVIRGIWQYRSDRFDAAVIKEVSENFLAALTTVVHSPQITVADIPFTDDTSCTPLSGRSAAEAPRHPLLLPQLFAQQVSADPQRIALSSVSGRLTYAELSARINRLANCLAAEMPGRAPVVAIFLPRDECLVVASVAVMISGATLLPLDAAYPAQRLRVMLASAAADLIIVNHSTGDMLAELACDGLSLPKALCLDEQASAISACPSAPPQRLPSPHDPAYIIFTSGSTGKPKGVVLSHSNLAHYIQAMSYELGIVDTDRYLYATSCAFSASVRQFVLPLANGASVVLAGKDQVENMAELVDYISREGVTILDLVPTLWRACHRFLSVSGKRYPDDAFSALRLLLSASEPLPVQLANTLLACWPHAEFINMYGQTETSGIVAMHRVGPEVAAPPVITPLGKSINGATLGLLDAQGKPVATDGVGEICVSGPCVGLGYLGEHGLVPLERGMDSFYRTGDLGRYLEDGSIEFCGRIDTQIKYRGFRIEPGDVEAVALTDQAVTEAAVFLAQHDSRADTQELRLAYCLARDSGQDFGESQLHSRLRDQLPDYMVPTRFIELQTMPRTASGKIDRAAVVGLTTGMPANSNTTSAQSGQDKEKLSDATQTLIAIWKDVLGCEVVGLHDNFFDLGGDSILSIEIVAEAMDAGLELDLEQLFRFQTIAELAPVVSIKESPRESFIGDEVDTPEGPAIRAATELSRYTSQSLRAFSLEALELAGLPSEGARILTEVQLESSLRGQATHNIGDVPRYAKRLASGVLNASPNMTVNDTSPISATVDGDNAPGQWVATVAIDKAISLAGRSGAGLVSVRRSNHFGAAGHYAWRASQAGLIGLCFTNGPVMLAPTGGVTPLFGNNPIAVGLPCGERDPVVLDIAMSTATRGKIGLTLAEGEPLQPGWILDELGISSTRLEDLAAGLAVPIGGHKGYGLAFAIEALAGALSGAGYCRDHDRTANANPAALDIGHLFIAFNPELFMARDQYEGRLADIVRQVKSSELAQGSSEIFVPGEIELAARRDNLRRGVLLPESVARRLMDYGKLHGLRSRIERAYVD